VGWDGAGQGQDKTQDMMSMGRHGLWVSAWTGHGHGMDVDGYGELVLCNVQREMHHSSKTRCWQCAGNNANNDMAKSQK